MSTINVKIQISRALTKLTGIDPKKVIANTLFESEQGAVTLARRGCPVRTGYLRDSIVANARGLQLIIQPTAHYGGYVHDGTWKMRARPWLKWDTPAIKAYVAGRLVSAFLKQGKIV